MKRETHQVDMQLRVLITERPDQVIAHALEMDMLGFGDTIEAAMHHLKKMISAQITLCAHLGDLDLIFFPADEETEHRWLQANREAVIGDDCTDSTATARVTFRAEFLTVTSDEITEAKRGPAFEPVAVA